MPESNSHWEQIYKQVPLTAVPQHYAGMRQSPFLMQYLQAILDRCPRGGRTLETGVGSGYGAVFLSLRGVNAEGIDYSQVIVERAGQVNTVIGGNAVFRYGDLFDLYSADAPRYNVIYHQGVLEHFTLPQIRAALAQQLALSEYVVFSVPSVYYPFPGEFGDERLLTLDVWQEILAPFDIEELKYYGDPQHGEKEHVLCILRGQKANPDLLEMMTVHLKPFPTGITGLVLARDEESNIPDCLAALDFCDEIIVVVMDSDDNTEEAARPFATRILKHPLVSPFDRARNPGMMLAAYSHILVVDADERVPAALGAALRAIITADPDGFEGMRIPFKHFFSGHWMSNPGLYPGYTAPRLLKNGKCIFNSRLHSGVMVDGRVVHFPADNPELAIHHYSFRTVGHHLAKQQNYTDAEARTMFQDGVTFDWMRMLQHAFGDLMSYYDAGKASVDGPWGLIYALRSADYRLVQHAKLFEMRANAGLLQPQELNVPQSTADILSVMAQMRSQRPAPQPEQIVISDSPEAAEYVATGPAFDRSGYAEEFRNAIFGLAAAGIQLRVQSLIWNDDPNIMTESVRAQYELMRARPAKPGFTHIIWDFPQGWQRHPNAGRVIVRTMHETDRFPHKWVQASHQADEIWVPTEFNRQTAIDSGIEASKLRVVPGAFDFDSFARKNAETQRNADSESREVAKPQRNAEIISHKNAQKSQKNTDEDTPSTNPLRPNTEHVTPNADVVLPKTQDRTPNTEFTFLSVFDWTLHKGWDILLTSFLRAFPAWNDGIQTTNDELSTRNVNLILKVWSTNGYSTEAILEQAQRHVMDKLGIDLAADDRIQFVFDTLSRAELFELYQSCDCFVLPSRGEGWGRPFTEAMFLGIPVIGSNWSGNTAFMNDENSYLVNCEVIDIPEAGWREIPAYKGHHWAEPNPAQFKQLLLHVANNPEEAAAKAANAQEQVREQYSREAVGQLMAEALRQGQKQEQEQAPPLLTSLTRGEESMRAPAVSPHIDSPASSAAVLPITERRTPNTALIPKTQYPIPTRYEGAFFNWHSLANVNRESGLQLILDEELELALIPTEAPQFGPESEPRFRPLAQRMYATLSRRASVHIKHGYPPMLNRPDADIYIHMIAWEYGYLPRQWVEALLKNVDEIWVYSNYVKMVCIDSGIPADKVQVIPLGVDTTRFHPNAPPFVITDEPGAARYHAMVKEMREEQIRVGEGESGRVVDSNKPELARSGVLGSVVLTDAPSPNLSHGARLGSLGRGIDAGPSEHQIPNTKRPHSSFLTPNTEHLTPNRPFIFLIVGGLFARKGADLIIDAYLKAFSAFDRVVLVAKNTGLDGPYRGSKEGERFRELAGDETRPLVVYLEHDIPEAQVPGLYTLADAVFLPYRGEGFCLPAAEAMACGRAVAVTAEGPTDDFVRASDGWHIKSTRKPCPPGPIGEWECCGPAWMLEPDVRDLVRIMREAYTNRELTREKGKSAREQICSGWTWKHTAAKMKERIVALTQGQEHTLTQETRKQGDNEDTLKQEISNAGNQDAPNPGASASKQKTRKKENQKQPIVVPEKPKLQLISGMEIVDRRSASTQHRKPGSDALLPNTGVRTPNTPKRNTQYPIPSTFNVLRSRPTIALGMMMRNEDAVIDKCLTSAKPFVTSIHIVDTGSTDRSIEIAESHGAIVIRKPWENSFSIHRNQALDMNRSEDYDFFMDCDDELPPECGEGMQRLVAMAEDRITAYIMQVHIPPAPGADGFTIVDHLKLFRHSPKHRWENRIHEQMLESIYRNNGTVERTNLYVVHSGYDYSPAGQKKKHDRDEHLLGLDEAEQPDHPFPKWNWGMSLHFWGEHDRAVQKLEECLALAKPTDSTIRKVYSLLTASYLELKRFDDARDRIDRGLSLYPRDPELLFRAGNFYRELGDPAAAEGFFLRMFNNAERGHIDSIDISTTTYKGRHNYALTLVDLNRFDEAEAQLRSGLAEHPQFAPSWCLLGEIFVQRRRFDDARGAIERLESLGSNFAQALQAKLTAAQNTRAL